MPILRFNHLLKPIQVNSTTPILDQLVGLTGQGSQRPLFRCPHSCRNGNCYLCEATLIKGEVISGNSQHTKGPIYLCQAKAIEDCWLDMPDLKELGDVPVQTIQCQIMEVSKLNHDVYKVELLMPAGQAPEFFAGQYLELGIEGKSIPFSIANAPDGRRLELHIRVFQSNSTAENIVDYLQSHPSVSVNIPMGDVQFLHKPECKQLILVASSTGFSQIKAICEQMFSLEDRPEIHLYWANQFPSDFYLSELPEDWSARFEKFTYHPILASNCDSWEGRTGLIYHALEEDFDSFDEIEMVICGSPNTVYDTVDNLQSKGLTDDHVHSDVFAYAPRQK